MVVEAIDRIDQNVHPDDALPDFTGVFLNFEPRIHQYLLRRTGNPEDANDLTQTTFTNAFAAWRHLPPNANIGPWLYRIATNASIDELRRKALIPHQPWDDSVTEFYMTHTDDETPESEALRHESIRLARTALNALPRGQRLALVLREYQELSCQEIADAMHLPNKNTAKSLLFRARKGFRQKYQELDRKGE